MSLNRLKLGNYRGDTIVEVIVVLAVLGMAISISYATASRSLLDARQAQEASQAAELIQSQLETLRTLSEAGNPQNIYQAGPYCIVSSTIYVWSSPTDATGTPCKDISNLYTLSVKGPSAPGGTFTIVASWDDVQGQGTDTSTLTYKLYQPPL
jgi:type II secretory pathway pseudopilin PulG